MPVSLFGPCADLFDLERFYQLIKELYLEQKEKVILCFFPVPILTSQSPYLQKNSQKKPRIMKAKSKRLVTLHSFFECNKYYYYYYCYYYQQFLLPWLRNKFYYNVKPINVNLLKINKKN